MQQYGLLGYPLGHSFSARYFAEKFKHEGIDARYDNFEFSSIEEAMQSLAHQPALCGFNVTIPYKEAILPYLDGLSPAARAIGAVNVVSVKQRPDGAVAFYGDNTDFIGFTESICPLLRQEIHQRALVLGTGGASRAVVYALHRLNIVPQYVSRHRASEKLAYEDLTPATIADHKVIVNCSPVGMFPHTDACPAIPYGCLTREHLLYDLVYNPLETLFLKKGAEQGSIVKNGLEMLHLQAEAAWKIWQKGADLNR